MTIERVEFHNRQNMKAFGSHRDRKMAGTNVRAWDLAVPQMGRRNFSFANWAALKHRIAASAAADELEHAIRANDRDTVVKVLRAKPELLHLPVWSGNWGPPMSHAAQSRPTRNYSGCRCTRRAGFSTRLRPRRFAGSNRVRPMVARTRRETGAWHHHGRKLFKKYATRSKTLKKVVIG